MAANTITIIIFLKGLIFMFTLTEAVFIIVAFFVLFCLFICLLYYFCCFIDKCRNKNKNKICKSCDYYDYGNNRCTFDYNENDLSFLPCSKVSYFKKGKK